MEFNKIISVSGKPGLFKIVSQSKNAIIVASLNDGKKIAVSTAQNVSLLENIAIYTYEEDMPLLDVFKAIALKTEGKKAISHKESGNKLTSFFSDVLSNYDDERVYTSNIKKVIQWFNILIEVGFDFAKVEATTNDNENENETSD